MSNLDLYVKVEDGKIVSHLMSLPVNIEVSIPEEARVASGWYPVQTDKPDTFHADTEIWESETFEIKDDHVLRTLVKRAKTQEELDKEKAEWWKGHRLERNFRLAETDWIITRYLERGQTIPTAWLEYRQALRDITINPEFNGSNYPTAPSL